MALIKEHSCKRLTEEEKDEIRSLYIAGNSISAITRHVCKSRTTVLRVISGLKGGKETTMAISVSIPMSAVAEIKAAQEMAPDGITLSKIAARMVIYAIKNAPDGALNSEFIVGEIKKPMKT